MFYQSGILNAFYIRNYSSTIQHFECGDSNNSKGQNWLLCRLVLRILSIKRKISNAHGT